MLIRVVEGVYDPKGTSDQDYSVEPKGREIWKSEIEDLTAASLHAAGMHVDPGTWYAFEQFEKLVDSANPEDEDRVFSTVSTIQSGVYQSWQAMIEVSETEAVFMVCKSLIEHIGQMRKHANIWIRIE